MSFDLVTAVGRIFGNFYYLSYKLAVAAFLRGDVLGLLPQTRLHLQLDGRVRGSFLFLTQMNIEV